MAPAAPQPNRTEVAPQGPCRGDEEWHDAMTQCRHDPAGLWSARHWGIPFVDVIPDMAKRPRRDEILAWIKDHPRVTRYAIVDDEDDELDELPLFQPSAKTGLTQKIVNGAARYLDGKTDRDMRCNAVMRTLQNLGGALRSHPG